MNNKRENIGAARRIFSNLGDVAPAWLRGGGGGEGGGWRGSRRRFFRVASRRWVIRDNFAGNNRFRSFDRFILEPDYRCARSRGLSITGATSSYRYYHCPISIRTVNANAATDELVHRGAPPVLPAFVGPPCRDRRWCVHRLSPLVPAERRSALPLVERNCCRKLCTGLSFDRPVA